MQHFSANQAFLSCQVLKIEVYNRVCLITLTIEFGTVSLIMSKHLFKALMIIKIPTYRMFIEFHNKMSKYFRFLNVQLLRF